MELPREVSGLSPDPNTHGAIELCSTSTREIDYREKGSAPCASRPWVVINNIVCFSLLETSG